MKKIFYILISVFVFSLVILGGLLISCDLITNKEDSYITESGKVKEPGVEPNDKGMGFIVSVFNVSDVEYVNIYRQDIAAPEKTINIGLLYPTHYHDQTWLFQDYFIYANHSYRYSVRYKTTKGIYKSGWSKTVTADKNSGYDDLKASFKYDVNSSVFFNFDEKNYTLTLSGGSLISTSIPKEILATDITPKIVFSNGQMKKAYDFPDLDPSTYNVEEGSCLWLRNVLEPEFTDVKITIEAIVFERIMYVDDKPENGIKCIIWGEPTDKLPQATGYSKGFTVKSTKVEAGYDYSD